VKENQQGAGWRRVSESVYLLGATEMGAACSKGMP
jgi:hypothetical protein